MLTGRCLCGGVRFEIDDALGPIVCCHCSVCRRVSGSAFASNATVRTAAMRIVAGRELLTEYQSSGNMIRAFCSRCGCPMFGRYPTNDSLRRIRVGSLDGDPGQRPSARIFMASKAPWFEGTEHLESFEEAPPQSFMMPVKKA